MDGHLDAFFPGCLRNGGALSLIWLMLYGPLSWYSLFSWFWRYSHGYQWVELSCFWMFHPVSRLPPSYGSNNHFFRLGILACHTRQLEFCVCRFSELPFDFVFHRFPLEDPAKRSKVNNIILGICTRTH